MTFEDQIFEQIRKDHTSESIQTEIQDTKNDYVDDDWEDEFDDIDEAYMETGRGGAESDVLNRVVEDACAVLGLVSPPVGPFCDILDRIYDEMGIERND